MEEETTATPHDASGVDDAPAPDARTLRAKLNLETAVIPWSELERHFARGAVLTVDRGLDLIEAAAAVAEDDRPRVLGWLDQDRLRRTTLAEARRWSAEQASLWTVVVAPWVLVQTTV